MKTPNRIIKTLFGATLSLFVTLGFNQGAAAQDIVFYAPVIATNVSRHTVSYTTNNQILTMNADGSNVRQLTTGTESCSFPSWQPGKTHILFFRGSTLYVMNADGSGTFPVATAIRVGADWSPDGNMICYVTDPASGPLALWAVNVDPSTKGNRKVGTPVLLSTGDFYAPVWSPDGTRIAFSDQSEPGGGPHIRVLDLATGAKSTLDSMQGLLPSWSSTGDHLAFVSGTDWQLFIMNADFSGATQVTSYNYPVLWPSWSPDDTQLAFRIGTGQNGDAAIYKLTLATGELTLLRDKGDHADWNP